MPEIIDLSQEIYDEMPVYKGLPQVKIGIHATHEEWEGDENASTYTPSVLKLEMSEHTGTHVDALSHMGKKYAGQSIDTMPISMFYTEGICLDFRYKGLSELITSAELAASVKDSGLTIKEGDTVLICTDHYKRYFGTEYWINGPGITAEAAIWLGEQKISAFGVETMSQVYRKYQTKMYTGFVAK